MQPWSYTDPSGDLHATGGINKDSPFQDVSPHSELHAEAARLAEEATVLILNDIRSEIKDDEKFGAYLNLFIKTATSVAYVIDTTGSMSTALPQIQATIPRIRSRLEEYKDNLGENAEINYILVPFNDPGLIAYVSSNCQTTCVMSCSGRCTGFCKGGCISAKCAKLRCNPLCKIPLSMWYSLALS